MLEVSGGTYEQPKLLGLENMTTDATRAERVRASTVAREAYFLDYAKDIRAAFKGALMVTGGFRSRAGMDAALQANACDIVGVGRPLCVDSNVVNKLLSGAEETTTIFEKRLDNWSENIKPDFGSEFTDAVFCHHQWLGPARVVVFADHQYGRRARPKSRYGRFQGTDQLSGK